MTPELLLFLSPVSEEGHPTSSSHVPVGASPGLLFLMTTFPVKSHQGWFLFCLLVSKMEIAKIPLSPVCLKALWSTFLVSFLLWPFSRLLPPTWWNVVGASNVFFCLFFYWENAGIVSFLFGLFWFHVCFPGSFHVQLLGFVFPSRQSHPRVNYPSDKSGILKEIKVSGFRFSFVRWPVFLSLSTLY